MKSSTSHSSLRPLGWCFVVLCVSISIGCGGGGGSSPASVAPTSATTPSPVTASILYDPPSPSTKQKTIIHSGLNNPKNSFYLSKQYFMSDVSAVRREGAKTALNDIANILGFFDITLYGAGQSLAILENEFLSKLCAITGRTGSDCNISNFYHEQQILTQGYGGYASHTGWEDSDSMSPSAFVFASVFDDYRYESLLMHEYFHIYQGHSMIRKLIK